MLATRLRWVSITPFIAPVVPLEYGRIARSLPGSISTSSGVAPSSPMPGTSSGLIVFFAFESSSCLPTSSSVSSGLIGVTTAPARRMPW